MKEKDKEKRVELFKKCVRRYIEIFGLRDYEVFIDEQLNSNVRASCSWHDMNDGAQQLSIFYSKQWIEDEKRNNKEIDKVAFHEVCEGLLSEINNLCYERFIQEREVRTAIHRIIRRLENMYFME